MMINRLLQVIYEKSPNLTERQDSSNPVIETHTQDTHEVTQLCHRFLSRVPFAFFAISV
jgi:hypothetical protein